MVCLGVIQTGNLYSGTATIEAFGYRALMRMTHADWLYFAKFVVAAFVVFYLNVWLWESRLAGSWRAGHVKLWKKPKRWQLVTFCVLWGLIIIAFIVAFSIRRSN
jgi:hypothetical protein